jgi:hypothetical protein
MAGTAAGPDSGWTTLWKTSWSQRHLVGAPTNPGSETYDSIVVRQAGEETHTSGGKPRLDHSFIGSLHILLGSRARGVAMRLVGLGRSDPPGPRSPLRRTNGLAARALRWSPDSYGMGCRVRRTLLEI